jgi:hypothetical protein
MPFALYPLDNCPEAEEAVQEYQKAAVLFSQEGCTQRWGAARWLLARLSCTADKSLTRGLT